MNAEWNIRACTDRCVACEKKFADRETLMSRLLFTPDGYVRDDFCADCWPNRTLGANTETSVWSAVWHAPAPKAPEALKKETAESLLREFMETEDPAKRNVVFILAVMLERRRLLVEKEVQLQPDGIKIRVYEHKQTGEIFVVPDPQLRLAEIESVQREVMELLGILPPKSQVTSHDAPAAEDSQDAAETSPTAPKSNNSPPFDEKSPANEESDISAAPADSETLANQPDPQS